MGVVGPKMMALSGEIADGNVLSVLSSPEYVRWARRRIAEGRDDDVAGRKDGHRITTFAFVSVGEDGAAAKARCARRWPSTWPPTAATP